MKALQVDRRARAIEKTIPPPVGGWNARDALPSMGEADAYVLENWYPRPSYVEMRGGSDRYMTHVKGQGRTLAVYAPPNGVSQMFLFTDQFVYNASFGGNSFNVSGLTSRTNGVHQVEQFGDGTNNWLIAVNGVDLPFYWNGTTVVLVTGVSSPAITGLTTTDLVSVAKFKGRLLFIRNNKLGFDYLPPGVVGGAASYFDLSSIASNGGYLMAIAVWSRDAGDGADDYAVFLTSEGEAIVYQGTDPSSATTWSLVGTFKIGKPLGRKCVLKYGADPVILTENGAFPLSALLASGDERQKFALSFKIQNAFIDAANRAGTAQGWRAVSFPAKEALVINVPLGNGLFEQFVMNTTSKAWTKFTGWHGQDFAVFNKELYYCRGYIVFKAWTLDLDESSQNDPTSGHEIEYVALQSYQKFGSDNIKVPVLFMPILDAQIPPGKRYHCGIDTDFRSSQPAGTNITQQDNHLVWGVSTWGNATWAPAGEVVRNWGGVASWPGRWLSARLTALTRHTPCKWMGSVVRYLNGGGL